MHHQLQCMSGLLPAVAWPWLEFGAILRSELNPRLRHLSAKRIRGDGWGLTPLARGFGPAASHHAALRLALGAKRMHRASNLRLHTGNQGQREWA